LFALAEAREELGWGIVGHQTAAAIAQGFLTPRATQAAITLLPQENGNLESVATWADQVKYTQPYRWSASLHFIDTPAWACDYIRSRDCYDEKGVFMNCVDGAIQNYTKRVQDTSLPLDQQAEALKFLVHFIGDIHQPLHCGFHSDIGGNAIKGTFYGAATNLHSVWDDGIIWHRLNTTFNGDEGQWITFLNQQIKTYYAPEVQNWLQCNQTTTDFACSEQWGQESVTLACQYAYVQADGVTHIANGFALSDDYYQHNLPIVEMQIVKAGLRMAQVLNAIWP